MAKYYTLVTDVGRAKMANAQVMGEKVSFSQIALGSSETKPRENQTALGKEEWRGPINNVSIDKGNPNWIVVEAVVPSNVGGFEIAEVGVYDEEGHLIVVGNHPKTYKPKMDEGTTKDVAIRIIIEVSNSEIVELKVDPSVVIATREYVESAIELAMASIDFSAVEKQIDQHVSNTDIHVTAKDKSNWNAKETPSAAQAKATKALEDAKAYTDQQIDAIPEVDTSHLETKEDADKKLAEAKSYTDIKADEALKQAKQHAEQIGENVLKDAKAYTQESASTLDLSNNPQMQSVQELAQQALQHGDKVKKDLVASLSSSGLPVDNEDSFEVILSKINNNNLKNIKIAEIEMSSDQTVVKGLGFKPDFILPIRLVGGFDSRFGYFVELKGDSHHGGLRSSSGDSYNEVTFHSDGFELRSSSYKLRNIKILAIGGIDVEQYREKR